MTKKEMEIKLLELVTELEWVRLQLGIYKSNEYLDISQAKKRDYIVRNSYIGKIKDKKIKDDFKSDIEKKCGDKFDNIASKILNYEFNLDGNNILNIFSDELKRYEYKQIVLDTYGDKKNEK